MTERMTFASLLQIVKSGYVVTGLLITCSVAMAADTPRLKRKLEIASFTGVWSDNLCDRLQPDRCGGFTLYLVQRGARVCGNHFFSTMGAGQLNEGMPRSVIGSVSASKATVSITSGRDNSMFQATIEFAGNVVYWQRLRKLRRGDDINDPLIPEKTQLLRKKTLEDSKNLDSVIEECNEFFSSKN